MGGPKRVKARSRDPVIFGSDGSALAAISFMRDRHLRNKGARLQDPDFQELIRGTASTIVGSWARKVAHVLMTVELSDLEEKARRGHRLSQGSLAIYRQSI